MQTAALCFLGRFACVTCMRRETCLGAPVTVQEGYVASHAVQVLQQLADPDLVPWVPVLPHSCIGTGIHWLAELQAAAVSSSALSREAHYCVQSRSAAPESEEAWEWGPGSGTALRAACRAAGAGPTAAWSWACRCHGSPVHGTQGMWHTLTAKAQLRLELAAPAQTASVLCLRPCRGLGVLVLALLEQEQGGNNVLPLLQSPC